MGYLEIIVSLAIIISIGSSAIWRYRQSLYVKLDIIYEKIELAVIKNNLKVNKSLKNYLLGIKTYAVNKELIDIQVLYVVGTEMKRSGEYDRVVEQYRHIRESLPGEVVDLEDQFNNHLNKLLILSLFKWDFLAVMVYALARRLAKNGIDGIKSAFRAFKTLLENEGVIGSQLPGQISQLGRG